MQLEHSDGIAIFRLTGPWRFQQAVEAGDQAIARTAESNLAGLLIVATGLTGFDAPTMAERHGMVRRWARTADGRVVVAMVTPPAFIDPERFAVVAAANFGLLSNVFACEREAEQWLRAAAMQCLAPVGAVESSAVRLSA